MHGRSGFLLRPCEIGTKLLIHVIDGDMPQVSEQGCRADNPTAKGVHSNHCVLKNRIAIQVAQNVAAGLRSASED